MRTVLDEKTLAFEAGYNAYQNGLHRSDNPYKKDATLRNSWFDGWDYANKCGGSCG